MCRNTYRSAVSRDSAHCYPHCGRVLTQHLCTKTSAVARRSHLRVVFSSEEIIISISHRGAIHWEEQLSHSGLVTSFQDTCSARKRSDVSGLQESNSGVSAILSLWLVQYIRDDEHFKARASSLVHLTNYQHRYLGEIINGYARP